MSAMKKIKVEEAVGTVLAHDITRIIPGKFKGVGFKKGHIIRKEDVPELLKLGKRNLYTLELGVNCIHEDDAALRIAAAICGDHLTWTKPLEGKSNIKSQCRGLLKINVEGLLQLNTLGDLIISTLKTHFPVRAEQVVAATRIIPLTTESSKIEEVEALAKRYGPILEVAPFRKLRVGGVATGSEIYKGLIKDEFDEYVSCKAVEYGCEFVKKIVVPDDAEAIAGAICELKEMGCELILTSGGLSVDPDDVTRMGVRRAGAKIIAYGSPILPGAMFLYAEMDNVRILGLPACVFYFPTTVYDLFLPRVLADEPVNKETIAAMGHGGLCMNCETCRYPACSFGK